MPKVFTKSTFMTTKFGSFYDHAKIGEKRQNVITSMCSSFAQDPNFLIFAIQSTFLLFCNRWCIVLLTEHLQKFVNSLFTCQSSYIEQGGSRTMSLPCFRNHILEQSL